MAEKLTPQQESAVHNRGGRLLVSAAAGSGKTKVLVDRLMRYLMDPADPANLDDFLIITFTKAAASELRSKIASKLSEKMAEFPENRHLQRQMQRLYLAKISTVHAFCGDILREYAYLVDLPADFRVADENECANLRNTCLNKCLEEAYSNTEDLDFFAFIDSQGLGRNDETVLELLLKVYDSARCDLSPKQWLQMCVDNTDTTALTDAGETPWGRYLIESLRSYLSLQISTYHRCAEAAEQAGTMPKPAALFRDVAYQLEQLRDAQTWDEVIQRKKIDYGRLDFPRNCPDTDLVEQLKATRNFCKDALNSRLKVFAENSEMTLADISQTGSAIRGVVKFLETFDREYSRTKRRMRIVDFSDLEHYTLDLLLGKSRSTPTQAAREIASRFREIMVDEYQDSNAVQDAIYMTLTELKQNCFMVGDVKQSIYQFRQADPGIFLKKYNDYAPADTAVDPEGRKVLLSSNFRSGGAVLAGANDVFRYCMTPSVGGLVYGEEEALKEGIDHTPLGEPEVEFWAIRSDEDVYEDEADFVARRIVELTDGTHFVRDKEALRPITLGDIAILLRTKSNVAIHYKKALAKRGIPCVSEGGEDILQTREGALLHAVLQTVSNPRQDIPLLAVLASPLFCVTADELAQIRSNNRYGCIYEALQECDNPKIQEFLQDLAIWRREARLQSLEKLLESIFVLTGIDSIFGAMSNGAERKENLEVFYQTAVNYEKTGHRDLEQFLTHLAGFGKNGLVENKEQSGNNAVTIMTIHKSKGLEFPVVFVSDLAHSFSTQSLKGAFLCDKDLGLGMTAVDLQNRIRYPSLAKNAIAAKITQDGLSESVRVLYVALTRARDRLIMTYAAKKVESDVRSFACLLAMTEREQLIQDVNALGDWVMLAALQRTEAGKLFALGCKPAETAVSQYPWRIDLVDPSPTAEAHVQAAQCADIPDEQFQRLKDGFGFVYPHQAATTAPSKQIATQRKGRSKDQEANENVPAKQKLHLTWRKPAFVAPGKDGAQIGMATHAVMQYIRYEICVDVPSIQKEVERLVAEQHISAEQGQMVNCEGILRFFQSDLGKRLQQHDNVLREFKFSVLEDAASFDASLAGEEILLQGVVDCAMIHEDGITVLDFKTDYVTEETILERSDSYRPQVRAYVDALSAIYELPIKEAWLYFFHLNRPVKIL
ncbi:MAG: helicase-exonuclease AddAB subunit AddA [Ruminococcaceae bacterium]|nr:helicase-exonuclease AddAB subunit AddA [Oscillospiraceae bacterium]